MRNPLKPGIKPVSPGLAGRFLTTGPPGKSLKDYFKLVKETTDTAEALRTEQNLPFIRDICIYKETLHL